MIRRQATPENSAAWVENQAQIRSRKFIEKAINDTNQIPPARLAQVIDTNKNIGTTVYGKSDTSLWKLASSGRTALADVGNSGTAARLLGAAKVGGLYESLKDAAMGDPSTALKFGAGIIGTPLIGNFAENNPLARRVLPALARSPFINDILRPAATNLGAAAGASTLRNRPTTDIKEVPSLFRSYPMGEE